ncbi:MAG TPA: glycosyltransferase family 1 protein [Candidatus Rubneribacter avistercoris]|nr:glycosyltransferase family 1 protein [Candidatus Rubneribacter avistercoris]
MLSRHLWGDVWSQEVGEVSWASAPIRVAHVMGKMCGGGVESMVMNYYRHIDKSVVQFDFLVDGDSALVPSSEINALGGRVFVVSPYQQLFCYMKDLSDLVRSQRWQIVHSHVNSLSVFPLYVANRIGVPVRIAHSHSASGGDEHVKNAAKAILKTQANRYPTHRLACSRYAGEWLFGENADFDVLYNAIELEHFAFDAETRAKVRMELGLTDAVFAVGHIGRFVSQKNQGFLIDAFAQLLNRRPDSVLVLVGDGEQRALMEHRAEERGIGGKVMFLGQRSDVGRIYQALDVFALPSLYEGLGIVLVEAQMAGLPCLASGTTPREVNIAGAVEFLPIDDPAVWAEALARLACCRISTARTKNSSIFSAYDINEAASWLSEYYVSALVASGSCVGSSGREVVK